MPHLRPESTPIDTTIYHWKRAHQHHRRDSCVAAGMRNPVQRRRGRSGIYIPDPPSVSCRVQVLRTTCDMRLVFFAAPRICGNHLF